MFENHNHVHALCSAFVTLGLGFYPTPKWFEKASKHSFFQLLMLTVWIYQSGGNFDFAYSAAIAIGFVIILKLGSYIKFSPGRIVDKNKKSHTVSEEDDQSSAEATEEEAESFLGYYN